MYNKFFKEAAKIITKYGLIGQIDSLGKAYYLEFQTKLMHIDGEGLTMFVFDLINFDTSLTRAEVDVITNSLKTILNEFNQVNSYLKRIAYSNIIQEYIPQKNSHRSKVYLLQNPITDFIKVGVSSNVMKRKKALETGSGVQLETVYLTATISNAYKIEKEVHRKFKKNRVNGEWYNALLYFDNF